MGGGIAPKNGFINKNFTVTPPSIAPYFYAFCHSKLLKMSLQTVTPTVPPIPKIDIFSHKKRGYKAPSKSFSMLPCYGDLRKPF